VTKQLEYPERFVNKEGDNPVVTALAAGMACHLTAYTNVSVGYRSGQWSVTALLFKLL